MIKYLKTHLNIKIFLLTFLILVGMAAAAYGFIAVVTPKSYLAELDQSIDRAVEHFLENSEGKEVAEFQDMLLVFAAERNVLIQFYDAEGNQIEYENDVFFSLADGGADGAGQEAAVRTHETKDYQILLGADKVSYTIKVLGLEQRVNLFSQSLKDILPWLAVLVLLVATAAAWFYACYITKPIIQTSAYSKQLAKMRFDSYQPNDREDEIGVLTDNLNQLSEQLAVALTELNEVNDSLQEEVAREKELEKQQLAFFSAVSHELKTPVTVLKGQLQGMLYNVGGYKDRDKYLQRSYEVTEGMEGLIAEILSVSRMRSAGFSINYVKTDVRELLLSLAEQYEELAEQRGLQVAKDMEQAVEIELDVKLFEKALSNIISNGIRYSPPGSEIRIKLHGEDEGALLCIENTNAAIQEQDIPGLFRAFKRGEESRSKETGGSGLGLYLVDMILSLHGFEYQMVNIEDGIRFEIHCKNKYIRF